MKNAVLALTMILAFAFLSARTIQDTMVQIESAKIELAKNEILLEQKITELGESNLLISAKDDFESDYEYLVRLIHASPQLELLRRQYLGNVQHLLTHLRTMTWETHNILITFGIYDPNSQLWDVVIQNNEYQKERYEIKMAADRTSAKIIHDNQNRLVITGELAIGLSDKIILSKITITDPVAAIELSHSFEPYVFDNIVHGFDQTNQYVITQNDKVVAVYDCFSSKQVSQYGQGGVRDNLTSIAFSPGSNLLAIGEAIHISGVSFWWRGVKVFNITTGKSIADFEHEGNVSCIAFSQDGKYLATSCTDNISRVFSLNNKNLVVEIKHDSRVNSMAISPNCEYLATAFNSKVIVFKLDSKDQYFELPLNGSIYSTTFSPEGKYLAIGCGDNKTRIFDINMQTEIVMLDYGKYVAWSPAGNLIACSGSGSTQLLDFNTSRIIMEYDAEGNVTFSPDGRFLAIGKAVYRTFVADDSEDMEDLLYLPPRLKAAVEFYEPSGNKYLDALETGKMKIEIVNSGQGVAKDITIDISPKIIPGLNYRNGFIAEVPAGETISVDIPIESYLNVSDKTNTLNINFYEANGFPPDPIKLTFTTRSYRKPQLEISDIGINDTNQNGKIETGEMIELTLRIRNNGIGTASGVYAKFYTGENVFLTDKYPKTQSLGDIQPRQSKDLPLEFFINDRCANEIPLYIDLTENTGLAGVSKLWVPVTKSDQARPITNVVVTGVENSFSISDSTSLQIDVEKDIPISKHENKNNFAVIFGVESYVGGIPRVLYALRDATWFREYALKTLGIPEQNIYFRVNESVTKNEFDKVFGKGGWLDKRVQKNSRVYFYFCGHGIPSLADKSAFLLPYDGDPNYADLTAYPLVSIYNALSSMKSSQNTVFLDACFTGISRENQALYATSRPVFISPQKSSVPLNVSVLSAADWNQMSNAWPEKQHGLFTYYLLKGMQGNADINQDRTISLGELFNYLESEVPVQAGRLDKEQTPQLNSQNPNDIIVEFE